MNKGVENYELNQLIVITCLQQVVSERNSIHESVQEIIAMGEEIRQFHAPGVP